MPYSQGYGPPLIDFGQMSNIVQQFQQGQEYGRQNAMRNAFANGLPKGPNGEIDFNAAVETLSKYDPVAAMKLYENAQAGGGASVYGTPIYGQDPETGETVLGAIGKGGTFERLDTGGVRITPGVQFLNQGTQYTPFDKRTGVQSGASVPIDVAGEKAAQKQGESEGAAQVNLPVVENATRRILSTIEGIEKSPGLSRATGPIQSKLPTISGDVADVEAKIEQATSGGFLQMYDQIRGAGHITEAEGAKASGALFRLAQIGQSDPGYVEALKEAKYEVFELLNVTRRKAGLEPLPNPFARDRSGADEGWTNLGNGVRIRQKQ